MFPNATGFSHTFWQLFMSQFSVFKLKKDFVNTDLKTFPLSLYHEQFRILLSSWSSRNSHQFRFFILKSLTGRFLSGACSLIRTDNRRLWHGPLIILWLKVTKWEEYLNVATPQINQENLMKTGQRFRPGWVFFGYLKDVEPWRPRGGPAWGFVRRF